MKQSACADVLLLVAELVQAGFPEPVKEHKFCESRQWRFDLAWIEYRVAFEREGFAARGTAGRHQRPEGYRKDAEKYNEAQIAGWIVVRAVPKMLADGTAAQFVIRALQSRGA